MTLWRLEWLRLRRTWRGVGLLTVFTFFGLLGPVTARYLAEILERLGTAGVEVSFPEPVPADGIEQYVGNVAQLGLLVLVAAAAGAFAFDSPPELGAFLRTRVSSIRRLVLIRFAVYAAAGAVAFAIGSVAAWYETVVLIGALPVGPMLAGIAYGALYFAFVIALVALGAGLARGALGTIVIVFAIAIAIAILGIVPPIGEWLPGRLAGAIVALARGAPATDYLRAAAATIAAIAVALALSIRLLERREL
ncbi:MAG: hypothetical protein WEB13_10590 [Dehalococcoidia bacterium]